MGELTFSDDAWRDYLYWQTQDRKTLKRINLLIQSIRRDGAANGLGKPERLKYASGWSRRIDDKNRLLYEIRDGKISTCAVNASLISPPPALRATSPAERGRHFPET